MARAKTLTFKNPDTDTGVVYEIDDARVGSEAYSTQKEYIVGSFCIWNNTLYKCISHVDRGSTWNESKWKATSVVDEISNKVIYLTNKPVTVGSNTTILTVNDPRITADHILVDCVFGDSNRISQDPEYTTSSGTLVLSGTCTRETTANIILIKED